MEVADLREKHYNSIGRDNYLFRVDDQWVVDATIIGGPARFINHSCDPNCYTRIVVHKDGSKHICIHACRDISCGEELCYDYKVFCQTSCSASCRTKPRLPAVPVDLLRTLPGQASFLSPLMQHVVITDLCFRFLVG